MKIVATILLFLVSLFSDQSIFAQNINPFVPIGEKIILKNPGTRRINFIKFDHNGNFYMGSTSDTRLVYKYDAYGKYIGKLDPFLSGKFEEIPFPLDIAFDRAGNAFISATWREGIKGNASIKGYAGILVFKDLDFQKIIPLQIDASGIVIDENDQIFVVGYESQEKTDFMVRKVDREGRTVGVMFPLPPGLDLGHKRKRSQLSQLLISRGKKSLLSSFPHRMLKVRPDQGEEGEVPLAQGGLQEKAKRDLGPELNDILKAAFQTEDGLLVLQGWFSAFGRPVQNYCFIYDAAGKLLREFDPKEAGLGYMLARDAAGYFYFLNYDLNSGNFVLTKTELRMDR